MIGFCNFSANSLFETFSRFFNTITTSGFFIKNCLDRWSKSTLISIVFNISNHISIILAILNALSRNILSVAVPLVESLKISTNYIMLKTSYILFVLTIISWASCFLKCLYSFFVFCKWSRSTICNPGCLKCISGIHLSPCNKIFHSLYILY